MMSPRPLLDPSPSPSPPPLPRLSNPVPSSTILSIEDRVAQLRRPSDSDKWVKCFVQTKDFENTGWAKICHLPQFHLVGKLNDGYMVTAVESVLPLLNHIEIPYSLEARPNQDDRRRLVLNAVAGISIRAQGLADLYRRVFRHNFSVPIEWAILLRDIKKAPPHVLETFYSFSFRLLDIHFHTVTCRLDINNVTFTQQNLMDVIERLDQANKAMATVPLSSEDIANHMHCISLLRGLLEHARGQLDVRQHKFNESWSANDNLRYLCELFCGSQTAGPLPSKDLRAVELRLDEIRFYAPFRFESVLYTILPADLIDNLPYNKVQATLLFGQHLPPCGPTEALSLFLCKYASVDNTNSLSEWMVSSEGRSKHGLFVQLLYDAQTRHQAWVYLGALMCFERVLGTSDVAAIEGSFFCRFSHDSKTLWHYVANCLNQIDRCGLGAVSWLVNEEWRPSQWMDHTLVLYWKIRIFMYWNLRGTEAHEKACEDLSGLMTMLDGHKS